MSEQATIKPLTAKQTQAVDAAYRKLGRRASSQQEAAACYGVRAGLLTVDDLPDFADDEDSFRLSLDTFLRDRGVMAGYLDEVRAGVVVADCPWWCSGGHPTVAEWVWGQPEHSLAVCQVTFDDDSRPPAVVKIIEDGEEGSLELRVDGLDTDSQSLSVREARGVSEALAMAADRLDQIKGVSA